MPDLLVNEQEEMDFLWRSVHRRLSLEQADRPLPQHGSLVGHPFPVDGQEDARLE
jgi:hypothetical protein